ncbi:hypothetical protein ScPMuIL_009802 [Solemya velum]
MTDLPKLFEFMSLVGQLKRVHRAGWVLRNVSEPESVADHMYRMSVMAFLADDKTGLDKNRCIKMALVHDMAESLVGDLTPADAISKEDKHKHEETAMKYICGLLSDELGMELFNLWEDYEYMRSREAIFVKDLDKFDMILQAHEYEQLGKRSGDLQEFFDGTKGKFQTTQVQEWAEELDRVRMKSGASNSSIK